MKKAYIFSAVGLVAAGLVIFLLMKPSPLADASGASSGQAEARRADELSIPGRGNSATSQQVSDWASKPSDELYRNFHDTKSRAEAGDAAAQRQLAEIYEQCAMYSVSPKNFAGMLDSYSKIKKENSSRYEEIKGRFSHYCSEVDGGEVIPLEAIELWYKEAARRGDLIAQLKLASGKTMSSEEYQDLVSKAIKSKDPEAIFAVEEMLNNPNASIELGSYAPDNSGNYSEFAWALAACEAGAACGAGSYRSDIICINYGICGSSRYEDAVRTKIVPLGQLNLLDKQVERIQTIIKMQQ
ncbi:hypothetical protein [Xanthomonas arboricola]|uniref:hypothetical protein n=1 Tax=Xanthomonas arboricola TaxID=56448 RepID=UPI00209BE248|nr:hypothetical protein [Xanthomonas arboricola]